MFCILSLYDSLRLKVHIVTTTTLNNYIYEIVLDFDMDFGRVSLQCQTVPGFISVSYYPHHLW